MVLAPGLRRRGIRAQQFMIEFANALDRLLQLLKRPTTMTRSGYRSVAEARLPHSHNKLLREGPICFRQYFLLYSSALL
jgi:hypothetical protein